MSSGSLLLTFDDGPDEKWTPRVLEELDRCEMSATFFLIGERVRAAPQIPHLQELAGHQIGLHCDRHIRHTELSEKEIEEDTLAALATLSRLGVYPTLWRTPWGVSTPATLRVAERHGLELVHWTHDTHDWRGDPAEEMLEQAASNIGEDAIVLMHDALGPGALREGCENTVALLAPLCALAQPDLRAVASS